jgi:hypothetical protein
MTARRLRPLAALLLGGATIGGVAFAWAQSPGPLWDRSQLPETRGTVKQYTLTPRGDVDGLILTDGTEVKLPPHLTGQVVYAVHPGDAVTVRGLRAAAQPLVQGSSVTNDATHVTVTDEGPPSGPARITTERTVSGRVAAPLHGGRGELNGAVLDDGTMIHLPPEDAMQMQRTLQPGQPIAVRGYTLATVLGTVVDVTAIGPSPDAMSDVAAPPPRGGRGRDRADRAPPPPPAGPRP